MYVATKKRKTLPKEILYLGFLSSDQPIRWWYRCVDNATKFETLGLARRSLNKKLMSEIKEWGINHTMNWKYSTMEVMYE